MSIVMNVVMMNLVAIISAGTHQTACLLVVHILNALKNALRMRLESLTDQVTITVIFVTSHLVVKTAMTLMITVNIKIHARTQQMNW